MKRIFLFIIAVIFSQQIIAQDLYEFTRHWPKSITDKAATAKNCRWMNDTVKATVFFMNIARTEPKRFADSLAKVYYRSDTSQLKRPEVSSLLTTLRNMEPVTLLQPDSIWSAFAFVHADDLGRNGLSGHYSSTGKSPFERYTEFFKVTGGALNENVYCGNDLPLDIIMTLLVDNGFGPRYGHRENILNSRWTQTGVAVSPHKKYGYAWCFVF